MAGVPRVELGEDFVARIVGFCSGAKSTAVFVPPSESIDT
jgi:hypothetical protein